MTKLDQAYQAMQAEPGEAAQAAYYAEFANAEVFVLLNVEPGEVFDPQLVEIDGVRYVLTFDTDVRMGAFCDGPTPYIAMSGRSLVAALDGHALGIGVNLGVAESAMLIPREGLEWIAERAAPEIDEGEARIKELLPPDVADVAFLEMLDGRLAAVSGPGRAAYLVRAVYEGETAHLMVFAGFPAEANAQVAGNLAEALRFAGSDLALDTIFVAGDAAIVQAASRVGLKFDLHRDAPEARTIGAPGTDPDKPPILH